MTWVNKKTSKSLRAIFKNNNLWPLNKTYL
jgi:hypothetical protein